MNNYTNDNNTNDIIFYHNIFISILITYSLKKFYDCVSYMMTEYDFDPYGLRELTQDE